MNEKQMKALKRLLNHAKEVEVGEYNEFHVDSRDERLTSKEENELRVYLDKINKVDKMKTIIRNILGKEFEIKIANSNIIDGVEFHYNTQDDKIFGSGHSLDEGEIICIIERDLMNRRDITLEKKYVIIDD